MINFGTLRIRPPWGSCSTAICNPTANTSDNRFKTVDGYEYDANGNVIEDAQNQRFVYDAENHQTAFFDSNNSGGTPDATYSYDGEGKRVKKISNTETTIFVYNAGGTLVAEYSTELAMTQQVSYLTADHLGSPRVISNENGLVTDRKDYSAFGEETISSQRSNHAEYSGADELRKGYTGYEKDDESGLDFAQSRYYNASHGRYTSVDPLTASASIKNPQTFNRYSYVLNSPYKFTDPLGLIPESTIACGSRCPNSGPSVDGSAFRGRDATFDWTEQQATDTGIAGTHELSHSGIPAHELSQLRQYEDSPAEIDAALTELFTDTGTVVGANGGRWTTTTGEIPDNHNQFANGVVHTIHINGDGAGVFIPKEFSLIKVTSTDTVVATNHRTKEVLMIAHVKVGSGPAAERLVRKNMQTVRENGTAYIGKTGGRGGAGAPAVGAGSVTLPHSHIQYHPSEAKRLQAFNQVVADRKAMGTNTPDFNQKHYSSFVADFRKFVR